jgi:hypothetical protein
MTVNEIERPLREEIAEIKEMLESMKKDIAAIRDNVDADISEKSKHKAFYTAWLSHDNNIDISDEGALYDAEPYIPLQGASQEMVEKAIEEHKKWEDRQNKFSVCGGHVE